MALSYSNITMQTVGKQKRVSGLVTFDSSYVTGGEPITLGDLGLYAIADLDVREAGADATHAYVASWDKSTTAPKIKLFQGDNPNVAAAQLIEVPNATNVSAVVCSFEAWGA